MSSSIILGNHVKDMVVFVEGLYLLYRKKVNPKASIEEFLTAIRDQRILQHYDFKDELPSNVQSVVDVMSKNNPELNDFFYDTQKQSLLKSVDLINNFNRFNDAQHKLYKDTIGNINRVIAGFTIILVLVMIIIFVYTWYLGSWYGKRDGALKVIQVCLIMTIFANIILSLYTYLVRINKRKKNIIKDNYNQYRKSYNGYISFITGMSDASTSTLKIDQDTFKDFTKLAKKLSKDGWLSEIVKKTKEQYEQQDNAKKDENDKLKYSSETIERALIQLYYQKYVVSMISNVFANGKGYETIRVLEMTSNDLEVYMAINTVFARYYDMMLASKQPDDESGDESIKETLKSFVINPLSEIDISGLEDDTTYNDKLFVKLMEEDENFALLMSSFKYVSIFMYPLFKQIDYNMVIKMEEDGKLKENTNGEFIKAEGEQEKIAKNADEKKNEEEIVFAFQNDKAMKFVHNNFPAFKQKFLEELLRIDGYRTVPSLALDIPVIDEFISLSRQYFNRTLNEKYSKYLDKINNANQDMRKTIYEECVAEFLPYFQIMFSNVLERKLALLNPTPSQYFIYQEEYMQKVIKTLFDIDELDEMDNNYKEIMINIFVNKIVKTQNDSFNAKYGDIKGGSLKMLIINSLIDKEISAISYKLSPFDIKVSNFIQYIKDGLLEKTGRTMPFTEPVSKKIESILASIDEEISKNKDRSNAVSTSRYIPMHTFIKQVNSIKYSTLKNTLRLSDASTLMKSFTYRPGPEENSLSDLKLVYTTIVLIFVLGYTYYLLNFIKESSWVKEQAKTGSFSINMKSLSDVTNQDIEKTVNTLIKVLVPFFISVMFLVIGKGYISKKETNITFNKDIMRNNTDDIQKNIDTLSNLLLMLDDDISSEDVNKSIADIEAFDNDKKIALYKSILSILVSFDKCNYIIGLGENNLPFPHGEVMVDSIMIITVLAMIGYIVVKFAPKKRVDELKELYEYQATAQMMFNDATFTKEIFVKYGCFKEEWSSMMFAVKGVGALGLIIFVMFYSITISQATLRYKSGLYTSSYAKSKRCV